MESETQPFTVKSFTHLLSRDLHADAYFLEDLKEYLSLFQQPNYQYDKSIALYTLGADTTGIIDYLNQGVVHEVKHQHKIYDFVPHERLQRLLVDLEKEPEICQKAREGEITSVNLDYVWYIQPDVTSFAINRQVFEELCQHLERFNYGVITQVTLMMDGLEYNYEIYTDWLFKHVLTVVRFEK